MSNSEFARPELESIEAFVDHLLDDDCTSFSFGQATELAEAMGQHPTRIIRNLKGFGLTMEPRKAAPNVRGFVAGDCEDRWSSCPHHGGAGINPESGMADAAE